MELPGLGFAALGWGMLFAPRRLKRLLIRLPFWDDPRVSPLGPSFLFFLLLDLLLVKAPPALPDCVHPPWVHVYALHTASLSELVRLV